MWRRYGDAFYTLITFGFFGFETIALGGLSIAFLLGRTSGIVATPLEGVLFAVVTSTASALALLGLYLLVYHFVSALRDRWHEERLDSWTERWITLALEDATGQGPAGGPAQRRLPPAAVEAVLRLLEAVKGEEGDRLKSGAGRPSGRPVDAAAAAGGAPGGAAGRDREPRQGTPAAGAGRAAGAPEASQEGVA
jgi:hypothetical protein